jgi:hypothetical protein
MSLNGCYRSSRKRNPKFPVTWCYIVCRCIQIFRGTFCFHHQGTKSSMLFFLGLVFPSHSTEYEESYLLKTEAIDLFETPGDCYHIKHRYIYKTLLLTCVRVSLPIYNLHTRMLMYINNSWRQYSPSFILGHIWEIHYLNKYSFEFLRNVFIAWIFKFINISFQYFICFKVWFISFPLRICLLPYSIVKQGWKCTFNLTLWRFRLTTVAMETQHCIFVFSTLTH